MTAGPSPGRTAVPRALVAALLVLVAALVAAPRARAQAVPSLRAPSAILVEPETGDIVFQRKPDARRPIASTTKLMTALVVLERATLSDELTAVRYSPSPAESVAGFRAGERLRVADLMRALLLASANDAAVTLATRVAGSTSAFVRLMNARARQLGLRNTRFANPIGLDAPGNYSSASDLVKIALILRRNAFFRRTVDLPRVTIRSGDRPRTFLNRNTLVRTVPFATGVKTGHTQKAGYVLVGSATRDGVTLLSAVLGDPSEAARNADTVALMRYGLRRYRLATAVRRGQPLATAGLRYGDGEVLLVAAKTVKRTIRLGEKVTFRLAGAPGDLEGPLPKGSRAGTAEIIQRGRPVARVGLLTQSDVAETTLTQRLQDYLGRPASLLLLAVLGACSLQLVRMRRRTTRRRPTDRTDRTEGTEIA